MDPEIQTEQDTAQTQDAGTTESNSQEMVPLHEASNADVKEALRAAQEREASESSEIDSSSTTQVDSSDSTQQSEGQAQSASGQVATSEVRPPAAAQTSSAQGASAGTVQQNELGNQKELLIRNRKTELDNIKMRIGASREQLLRYKAGLEENLEEVYRDNPMEGSRRQRELEKVENHLSALDRQEQTAEQITEAQTLFTMHVDLNKVGIEDMVNMFRASGMAEEFVQKFVQNPWTFMSPDALVEAGKRAEVHKNFIEADNDRRILANHVLYLNAENQKLRGKTQATIGQINRNLRQTPGVTARSTGAATSRVALDPNMIPNMTREQIKDALEKQVKAELH